MGTQSRSHIWFTDMKLKLVLVLWLTLLVPLLEAQTMCPVLQAGTHMCSDTCIENMDHTVSISGGFSDYTSYLKSKYSEFLYSDCHMCIYIYCGLIHQSYGTGMAHTICDNN